MLFSGKTTYQNTDVNFYLLIQCNIYFQLLQLLFYSFSILCYSLKRERKKKKRQKSDRNNWELWKGGNEISFSWCYPEWHRIDVEAHLWLFPDVCEIISVLQLFFMWKGICVKFFVQVARTWKVTKIILKFMYHKHCTI